MTVLTDEEIDRLKETHPKKKILRIIFLIIGILLILLGCVALLLSVNLGVIVEGINISFAIDILIIVFGMILASKYWIAPYYLRENSLTLKRMKDMREPVQSYVKFNSVSISRLLAALFFLTVGFWCLTVFGIGVGHEETRYGTFFVLGGPSYFYPSGLPALIIGLSLVLYFFLSLFRGTFSQSENFYFFYELRPACPWLTEIPKKDIEAIRFQNNHLGPKLTWVILLMPFIVLQLMTAVPLFFNNERQAPEYVFSTTLTMISILEIVALIILVGFPQNYYEIATEDMLYEMWFSPLKNRGQHELRQDLADYLDCGIEERELESNTNQPIFSDLSNTHHHFFDLIFGLFLIISAIVMLTQMVLFGPMFWWVALMFGLMLIFKAISYDFSRKGADKFYFDEQNKIFKFQRKFGYKFHYVTAYKVESVEVKKWYRKLDFFDIFGLGGMIVMLVLQQTEGWGIINWENPSELVIMDNIISTIFMVVVFIFIILYLCLPVDVIEFKTPSITHRIRVTTKLKENKSLLNKYMKNLKSFTKDIKGRDMKKVFLKRISVILILALLTLAYTIYTLYTYFY